MRRFLIGLFLSSVAVAPATAGDGLLDLSGATVVVPAEASPRVKKAAWVLLEESHKRTGIKWSTGTVEGPGVVVSIAQAPAAAGANPEGFRIGVRDGRVVEVVGNGERGVLFGVGRLLREIRFDRGRAQLPSGFATTESPAVKLRGHQLGYRPKTNSYDAWDLPQWDQYIRDLAIFGTNAIELIPPRSDDLADSPHFPRPPMEMMIGMSKIADEYGLDVWVWYPALDKNYDDPKTVEFAIKEWADVLSKLPRLDAVLVPGGDPGHTQPKHMMALLEKQTASIRRFHPRAEMWMSPQGFNEEWFDEFLGIMKTEPAWLTGIVYGPQVRMRLPDLRRTISPKYPIRLYPDITHSLNCQYPVPDWDVAYSLTHERESINPRPTDQAAIFHATIEHSIGFLTYSEGCNDDVNKFVWSGLGWNPARPVVETLREFGRYFISARRGDDFAQGLLALERNWKGPLATNAGVETTLRQFQGMERSATPSELLNWRFQQALYRAYFDAYVRDRLIRETAIETEAIAVLREARSRGSFPAVERAAAILRGADEPTSIARRTRVYELAEALYQSIRMQLSVSKYQAINGRGNTLDTLELPLNDRRWLEARLDDVRRLPTEPERLAAIDAIVGRTDPGPGGFYDDLGDPSRSPHLVKNEFTYEQDPDFRRSNYVGFEYRPREIWPLAWCASVQSLYAVPIRMRYDGLDPSASYRIRITYAVDNVRPKMELKADDTTVHSWIAKPDPPAAIEFDVPVETIRDGSVTFTWRQEPGRGGNGRGCQIAEVWLIKR